MPFTFYIFFWSVVIVRSLYVFTLLTSTSKQHSAVQRDYFEATVRHDHWTLSLLWSVWYNMDDYIISIISIYLTPDLFTAVWSLWMEPASAFYFDTLLLIPYYENLKGHYIVYTAVNS